MIRKICTAALSAAALSAAALIAAPVHAGPSEDVVQGFDTFLAAQNAHDLQAVRRLLADGPQFVWITRGTVLRGPDQAIARFRNLYAGTWQLAATARPQTVTIDRNTVQLIAPVTFTIGAPGAQPTRTQFILTQLWHRQGREWRIASLLPILVPAS